MLPLKLTNSWTFMNLSSISWFKLEALISTWALIFNFLLIKNHTIFELRLLVIVVPIKSKDNKQKTYSTYSLQYPEQDDDDKQVSRYYSKKKDFNYTFYCYNNLLIRKKKSQHKFTIEN